jgi:hypothetical protein
MITSFFLLLISSFVSGFMKLLPLNDSPYPQEVLDGWSLITEQAMSWNNIIPVFHMFSAFSLYVFAWSIVILWFMIRWLLGLIRGSGT